MATFEAVSSELRLRKLYDRARTFATSGDFDDHASCRWFYRNQSDAYFRDIFDRDDGLMTVRLKDASGDPRSPINGRLSGLFFMASVRDGSQDGEPLPMSPFGSCRLLVSVKHLLTMVSKIYFTDFYCMTSSGYHYVTLVITDRDSEADRFCKKHLLSVDLKNNPFLFVNDSGKLRVTTKDHLFVEIFYTKDLNISEYDVVSDIPTVGKGHSTPGGIPKNSSCPLCNV